MNDKPELVNPIKQLSRSLSRVKPVFTQEQLIEFGQKHGIFFREPDVKEAVEYLVADGYLISTSDGYKLA